MSTLGPPSVGVADPAVIGQSQLEQYYRSAPVGLFVIDRELRYISINERLARAHGLPVDQHIGKTLREVIPEIAPNVEPDMRRTLETGEPTINAELTTTTPAEPNLARHWLVSYYALEDSAGDVIALSGVVQDITSRQEKESKLREQLRFEALLASVSRSFVEVSADKIDNQIEGNLARIAEHFEVDRATLARFSPDATRLAITHSWAREGFAEMERLDMMVAFPWYSGKLAAGDAVRVSQRADLPEGSLEREYADRVGLHAAVSVPTSVAGSAVCVIAMGSLSQERQWCDDTVDRLRLLGEIFALALNRVSIESALREANAEIERLNERLRAENVYLREEIAGAEGFDEIIGESTVLRAALRRVEQVAVTDATVLVVGETGTGKELVAHAIHRKSERSSRPFITVNCSALPAPLIESELFGHEKGAFTGAHARQIGRFELADGGTIFLDEIGDLPIELQSKLLRVLQTGDFERLGSSSQRRVDVRVVAATHRDLERAVEEGRFRADLYYRLRVVPIHVPALRERSGDIPLLVWYFLSTKRVRLRKTIEEVPRRVMDAFLRYDWPGNVRELENVIERAMILSPDRTLTLEDALVSKHPPGNRKRSPSSLSDVERGHIVETLEACAWRINGSGNAAERLGLHPSTLRLRMKKLGVHRPVS